MNNDPLCQKSLITNLILWYTAAANNSKKEPVNHTFYTKQGPPRRKFTTTVQL